MAQVDDLKAALVEANERTDAIALALEADALKLEEVSGDVDKLIELAQAGDGDLTEVLTLAEQGRVKLAAVAASKQTQSEQLNAVAAKYER